ncbi:bile acid:sodium symporter [Salinirubellus salinus]|uniref:Bile acid:sodium symporter n=1 Tax=Salinirubellus salinus TaxID=1364945 RepID=A0A9E7R0K6_9EURY|nr:bile acid:sodium symporter [Salinirubellus salinus]UWM53427.1 bile acid:sodium symporter [Salinirubellus salinus]
MIAEQVRVGLEPVISLLLTVQGIAATVGLAALMAQFGIQLTVGDLRQTTREYNLVSRWLVANLLFLPLVAALFGVVFQLPRPLLLTLVLVAVAPGAPFIPPLVAMAGHDSHEAVRLTAALTVVAVLTVPLFVAALLFVLDIETDFSPWRLLSPLGIVLVAPMIAGIAVRTWRPELAERLARPITLLANLSLLLALGIIALLGLPQVVGIFAVLVGTGAILLLSLFVLVSIGIGWVLGGPTAQSRRILALGTAGRNVNIALFVATGAFPESGVNGGIIAFTVLMFVLSILVARYWRRKPLDGESSTAVSGLNS